MIKGVGELWKLAAEGQYLPPRPYKEIVMFNKIALFWATIFMFLLVFLSVRLIIPYLVNAQNDGAIVLAVFWFVAITTTAYVYYKKILVPFLGDYK